MPFNYAVRSVFGGDREKVGHGYHFRNGSMGDAKSSRSYHSQSTVCSFVGRRSVLRSVLSSFHHQCHRDATPHSVLKIVLVLSTFTFVLNYLGILDHVFEEDYEKFKWPMSHVDVARQVSLLRNGSDIEYLPVYTLEFRFVATPKNAGSVCAKKKWPLILVLVKSRPWRGKRRERIREWWKKEVEVGRKDGKAELALYFLTGTPSDRSVLSNLLTESDRHNDLISGSFVDNGDDAYENQTLNVISAWKWTYEQCSNAPAYTLLISDLYKISTKNLLRSIQNLPSDNEPLYFGHLHKRATVDRSSFGCRSTSLSEYPFAQFPPYVDSGAVLFSKESLTLFYLGSQYVKPFRFDDVYTGIVAKLLKLQARHSDSFVVRRLGDRSNVGWMGAWYSGNQATNRLDWNRVVAGPVFG